MGDGGEAAEELSPGLPVFSARTLSLLQRSYVDFLAYNVFDQHCVSECLDAFPSRKNFTPILKGSLLDPPSF